MKRESNLGWICFSGVLDFIFWVGLGVSFLIASWDKIWFLE